MKKTTKNILKEVKFGIEFELFTLDKKGYMINAGERLINLVNKKYPEVNIAKEVGKNMVEIITPPFPDAIDTAMTAIDYLEKVLECAREEKINLYYYGTYPGCVSPEFYDKKRYKNQAKIIGKQRFSITGRCVGMHLHYTLPWGVFDSLEKIIKPLIKSKNKQSMINVYNLCIAMDPALTTFAQSSPFYQGENLGKDSRMIVYRGGKELNYPQGLYANLPQFGALQGYKSTSTDILQIIYERFSEWSELSKKIGRNVKTLSKRGSVLDNAWNPVKINSHGTMEIRGMDMNHPDLTIAVAVVTKFIIEAVQEKYFQIIPSDIGIDEPFKREGKNIYIPPDSYVLNILQKKAAYFGLEDDAVYRHCSGLLKLAKHFIPLDQETLIEPLEKMLKERQTHSDYILEKIKEKKWLSKTNKKLTSAQAAEIALEITEDLADEILATKQKLILLQNK